MHDLIVRGGQVVDGTGAPARRLDVAVSAGRIAGLGTSLGEARRVIDAAGHVVAPGFIDIHTHSDYSLPANPKAESKIRQGVTTEVVGNCGYSVAPVPADRVGALREYLAASGPWYDFRETTFARYVDEFPATSVNVALQVGHNTLRLIVAGMEPRPLRPDELGRMTRLLEEGLDAGAIGLSSGLFTPPGVFASPEEMHALGAVLRRHGAAYASHIRNEAGGVLAAVDEAIAVGERADVHVQIGHLKVSGTENWGGAAALVERVEAARRRGVRVDCDQYPYTTATNPLRNLLPAWIQDGGIEAMLGRLADRAARTRIAEEVAAHGCASFGKLPSWDAVRIALTAAEPALAGRTIGEIAAERGRSGVDTACDVLLADRGATRVVFESMAEDDVRAILTTPWVVVGSDGVALAPYGPDLERQAASALLRHLRPRAGALRARDEGADARDGGAQDDGGQRRSPRPHGPGLRARRTGGGSHRVRSGDGGRAGHLHGPTPLSERDTHRHRQRRGRGRRRRAHRRPAGPAAAPKRARPRRLALRRRHLEAEEARGVEPEHLRARVVARGRSWSARWPPPSAATCPRDAGSRCPT